MIEFIKEFIIFCKTKPGKYGRIHQIQFQGWMKGYDKGLDFNKPKRRLNNG